eukprot:1183924-Prorocentrum_minimum.AAC.1
MPMIWTVLDSAENSTKLSSSPISKLEYSLVYVWTSLGDWGAERTNRKPTKKYRCSFRNP